MLQNFTPRLYQQTIFATAAIHNTLVVLPTGMGKTGLALMMTAHRLQQFPNEKILLLAPTKPLCEQHVETLQKSLEIEKEKIVLFTGSVSPKKREDMWKKAQIIVSTPQGLENDLINNRISFNNVSLCIFDEAHHASGDYAYVWIAKQYIEKATHPRILALTASPGANNEAITEILTNLSIEKVEVRTEKDHDVAPYVQEVDIEYVLCDFPTEYKEVQAILTHIKKDKLTLIKSMNLCNSIDLTKGELLKLQIELQRKISEEGMSPEILKSISLLAEAQKIEHGLELLETQGIEQLKTYLEDIKTQSLTSKTKAVQNLVRDEKFTQALTKTNVTIEKNITHPKVEKLLEIIQNTIKSDTTTTPSKAIIFTQFRDSAEFITNHLTKLNITNHIFVGQAKKNGLGFSQKQQKEILDNFRTNQFSVLVATSVAEEGLDIPKVDLVLFYEPIPSAIRAIQRRGRTGRLQKGGVKVLVTKGTRDEIYRWTAHHKEKRMHVELAALKTKFQDKKTTTETTPVVKENRTLNEYETPSPSSPQLPPLTESPTKSPTEPNQKPVLILADHREKNNTIVKELIAQNITVRTTQLERADYVLSGNVGVELKKVPDFVNSILDGRLLEQLLELKKGFPKVLLIVEGTENIYAQRNIHPNAIRGMMATIAVDFHIPLMFTRDPQDTASLLALIATREQDKSHDFASLDKKGHTQQEQMERFIASLPNIGLQTAKKLLDHFNSINHILTATETELTNIEGIGPKTSKQLKDFITKEYKEKKSNK